MALTWSDLNHHRDQICTPSSIFVILKFKHAHLKFSVYGRKQTNRQTDIHTHVRNAVTLVWGSLRLTPITGIKIASLSWFPARQNSSRQTRTHAFTIIALWQFFIPYVHLYENLSTQKIHAWKFCNTKYSQTMVVAAKLETLSEINCPIL